MVSEVKSMCPSRTLVSTEEPPEKVSTLALLEAVQSAREALQRWAAAHVNLSACLCEADLEGWLAGGEVVRRAPDHLLRALDTLEYDGERPLQAIGLIRVPRDLVPVILEANAARIHLDEVTMPLRKMCRGDLERLPEGTEVGGRNLQYWIRLTPSSSIWKAVAPTLDVPRIYLAQVTRHLIHEGLMLDDLPEGLGFCWTMQRVIRAVTAEELRETLEEMVRSEGPQAEIARKDIGIIDHIGQRYGRVDMAYIHKGHQVPSVNLSWADGRAARKLAPLPLFWAGDRLPNCPPLPAEPQPSRRRPRKDRKYTAEPILHSLNVHAAVRDIPGQEL